MTRCAERPQESPGGDGGGLEVNGEEREASLDQEGGGGPEALRGVDHAPHTDSAHHFPHFIHSLQSSTRLSPLITAVPSAGDVELLYCVRPAEGAAGDEDSTRRSESEEAQV